MEQSINKLKARLFDNPDALALSNGGKLSGKPFELVQQALTLEPNNTTGLRLAGLAYEEQGQFKQALASFNKLKPQLTDANSRAKVNELIAKMETQLGLSPSKADVPQMDACGAAGIEVEVMA